MALPPEFLDELKNRLVLSDVAGRKVLWDRRKSNAAKGDFWAPCPFHQEKTPSFHVDDRKGFYYCFGCHEKGSLFDFVMKTDNLSFIEAVEFLAGQAGVEMPARTHDPRAAERRDRQSVLFDVMEQTVRAFRLALNQAAAAPVRDYITGRGLIAETVKRFELGFAPDDRQYLTTIFREKGQLDEAIAAGLVIRPDDGGSPYDRFRGRLMFPIRDARGRCIAFGGRAMSEGARAKYLNSPETELFHKGRTLYHHGPAREAAGKAGGVVVAEGYMDVIALAQSGFEHAVAPLGTAITEEQLGLLWRIADEPVIALDGDQAGLRAAERLIDLALPLLAPGKSLRFCLLPEGRDPDDLIKMEGHAAMHAALEAALPLIEMLWRRETASAQLDTPERRAALDQRLRELLRRIDDESVRTHYAAEIKGRRANLFRPARPHSSPYDSGAVNNRGRQQGRFPRPPTQPMRETLGSDLARRTIANDGQARLREAAILLIALRNPGAIAQIENTFEAMIFTQPDHERIRDGLVDHADSKEIEADLTALTGLEVEDLLTAIPQARAHPMARRGRDPAAVAVVLEEAIDRHHALLAHADEMADARRELGEADDERWSVRVAEANRERQAADSRVVTRELETTEEARDSRIQRLLDDEVWRRSR